MAYWLSYARRDPIPGVGTADFTHEDHPTWKLLVHTTEGTSYAGARASYVRNGFAPNLTVGPAPTSERTVMAWQHLPLNSRATTLADDAGGIRTNRDHVVQVEIVGFADLRMAAKYGRSLGVDAWPDWYEAGVAKVLNDILDAVPIPRRSTVRWVSYPASYGERASQRLSGSEFDAYAGILGHQHAPENDHGDPGDLSAFVRDYLLTDHEEEDMTKEQAQQLAEVHAALATIGSTYKQAKLEPERYADLLKAVQTWGGRAQSAGQAAEAKVDALAGQVAALAAKVEALTAEGKVC